MSKLDDILEHKPDSEGNLYQDENTKQQIKDLMLELVDESYKESQNGYDIAGFVRLKVVEL